METNTSTSSPDISCLPIQWWIFILWRFTWDYGVHCCIHIKELLNLLIMLWQVHTQWSCLRKYHHQLSVNEAVGTWSLCRPQPCRHAWPVTSHQLHSWGWRGGSQSATDAAGIFWHQHATSSDRFCVSHSPIHYISLNVNDVLVFLRSFHWNSIPVTGFFAVHPFVPEIQRQLLCTVTMYSLLRTSRTSSRKCAILIMSHHGSVAKKPMAFALASPEPRGTTKCNKTQSLYFTVNIITVKLHSCHEHQLHCVFDTMCRTSNLCPHRRIATCVCASKPSGNHTVASTGHTACLVLPFPDSVSLMVS